MKSERSTWYYKNEDSKYIYYGMSTVILVLTLIAIAVISYFDTRVALFVTIGVAFVAVRDRLRKEMNDPLIKLCLEKMTWIPFKYHISKERLAYWLTLMKKHKTRDLEVLLGILEKKEKALIE